MKLKDWSRDFRFPRVIPSSVVWLIVGVVFTSVIWSLVSDGSGVESDAPVVEESLVLDDDLQDYVNEATVYANVEQKRRDDLEAARDELVVAKEAVKDLEEQLAEAREAVETLDGIVKELEAADPEIDGGGAGSSNGPSSDPPPADEDIAEVSEPKEVSSDPRDKEFSKWYTGASACERKVWYRFVEWIEANPGKEFRIENGGHTNECDNTG